MSTNRILPTRDRQISLMFAALQTHAGTLVQRLARREAAMQRLAALVEQDHTELAELQELEGHYLALCSPAHLPVALPSCNGYHAPDAVDLSKK